MGRDPRRASTPRIEMFAVAVFAVAVVLARDVWSAWLDPSLPTDGAIDLLGVPPVEDWVADPVSNRVNAADHDDEQCIAPISMPPPEPPKQGSLF